MLSHMINLNNNGKKILNIYKIKNALFHLQTK